MEPQKLERGIVETVDVSRQTGECYVLWLCQSEGKHELCYLKKGTEPPGSVKLLAAIGETVPEDDFRFGIYEL